MNPATAARSLLLAAGTAAGLGAGPAAAEEGDPLADFFAGATYELTAATAFFPMDAGQNLDDDTAELWSRAAMTGQAALGDKLTFRLKTFAILSTGADDHRGAFTEPTQRSARARHVDLARLALTWDDDAFALTVGKSDLSAGLATLYSPADRFETAYAATPMHGFKTGVWQARLDVPVGDDTATAAVLPFDTRSAVPGPRSRWLGSSGSYQFYDLNLPVGTALSDHYRDPAPDNWGYLLKYKGARSGYDFFVLAHHGPSVYPVVRQTADAQRAEVVFPVAHTLAAGVAATIDRWELHGEFAHQLTRNNADQDFLRYVFGVSYRDSELAGLLGIEEIQPVIEYAGEWVVDDGQGAGYLATSFTARPFRDAVLGRVDFRINDEWRFVVGGSFNFVDRDASATAGIEYKYSDNLTFRLDARHFEGGLDTQFGRWRRNDHFEIGFEIKF